MNQADVEKQHISCVSATGPAELLKTIKLAPAGEVQSLRGTFIVDKESGRLAQAEFEEHGVEIPIDYEHRTLSTELAPAAGWIKRIWFEEGKGLMAAVEWTEEGAKMIRSKQYKYLSPVVLVRKTDRKVVAVHSAALTNKPAIPGMEALAASERKEAEMPDPRKQRNQEEGMEGGEQTPDQHIGEIKALLKQKGVTLEEGAGRDAVLKAVISFLEGGSSEGEGEGGGEGEAVASSVRKELGLKEGAGKDDILLAVCSLKERAGSQEAVAKQRDARLDELEKIVAGQRADELMANAVKANKLNPNNKRQMEFARKKAIKDPKDFEEWMACEVAYATSGRTAAPPRDSVTAGDENEEKLIANAVKVANGDYGAAIAALQVTVKQPYIEQGLTNAAANKAAAQRYPKIFGVAA